MPRRPMPDAIVLVPGILGSELSRGGRCLWGLSAKAVANAVTSLGGTLDELTLAPDGDLVSDDIEAVRVLPDLQLIPYLWKIDGYTAIAEALHRHFDLEAGVNYFEFPYDWRRDNRVAAHRLQQASHDWLRDWRRASGNDDARLIILAHSMGGLVARYFLEVLEGWRTTKALVSFGTPYRGSVNALRSLAEGIRKGPFGVVDLSRLARSLTSLYQLLPIYPCLRTTAGESLRLTERVVSPNLDAERVAAAFAFHREIREAVTSNQADERYRSRGYRLMPIVGTHQETLQSATIDEQGALEFVYRHAGADWKGDGTVPRSSATPVELGDQGRETFVATAHASIQNAPAVLHHVCEAIAGLDLDLGAEAYRGIEFGAGRVGLKLEDAYWDDEPIAISVDVEPAASLDAQVVDAQSDRLVAEVGLPPHKEATRRFELPPLPPGSYRCAIQGRGTQPVCDVFSVYPAV